MSCCTRIVPRYSYEEDWVPALPTNFGGSGKGGNSKQVGTTAQKKEAGRKGGKAAAKKN